MTKWTKWTAEELDIVKKNYGTMTTREIAGLLPGRTVYSVRGAIVSHGLSSPRKKKYHWTDKEIEILMDNVGKMSVKEMTSILPGRPASGISSKIAELGLKHNYHPKKSGLFIDIEGQRFGRLVALEYIGNRKWLCECDCGNTTEVGSYSLRSGMTKSCGCIRSETSRKPYRYSTQHKVYSYYKAHARRKGYPFTINKADFLKMIVKPCFYCGNQFGNINKSEYNNGDFEYTGIDRFDPNLGYTIENCVPCCKDCNMAKNTHRCEDFIAHMHTIVSHNIMRVDGDYCINQWSGNGERVLDELYKDKIGDAENRGINFKLSIDQFKELISSRCSYCGAIPSNIKKKFGKNYLWNGIDRFDNEIGYIIENCVSSCTICNRMKHTMTADEFISMAERISIRHE